jgi:hypothetical protein
MDRTITKFDQISAIYSRFSEKNKENLIKTAKSLLKIQNENEAMLAEGETQWRLTPREDFSKTTQGNPEPLQIGMLPAYAEDIKNSAGGR